MSASLRLLATAAARQNKTAGRMAAARALVSHPPQLSIGSAAGSPSSRCWLSTTSAAKSSSAPKPSAFDVVIQLTFVDPNGARRRVPGLVGKTLHQVCMMHGIDIGPECTAGDTMVQRSDLWIEPTFGEGATSGFDHVIITGKGAETAPLVTPQEEMMLSDYWDDDEIFPESRLASCVTLTKEMDGMIVYVPDRIADDIP